MANRLFQPLVTDCPDCLNRPGYIVTRLYAVAMPELQCCEEHRPGKGIARVTDKDIRAKLQAVAEKSYRVRQMTYADRAYASTAEQRKADRAEQSARNGKR